MEIQRSLIWVSVFAAAVSAAHVHADVLKVGPNQQYLFLQTAIDSASDGDTILVHAGTYSAFSVDHKSLSIVADPVDDQVTTGKITITNIAAGQRLSLCGLNAASSSGTALSARNNAGSLRFQAVKCSVFTYPLSGDGAQIDHCHDVELVRCVLVGGDGTPPLDSHLPGVGLKATLSNVAAYDCTIRGGVGIHGGIGDESLPTSPSPGAIGASITGGQMFLSGSAVTGGAGGNGSPAFCGGPSYSGGPGATGGTGLVMNAGTATLLDTTIMGGQGGAGGAAAPSCSQPGGAPGTQGARSVGTVRPIAGSHRSLVASTPVRELTTLDLTLTGTPGDQVWLSVARDPQWLLSAQRHGVTLIGSQARGVFLGTVPGTGLLQSSLPIEELGVGVDASTLYLQAACSDATGALTLTGSDVVVLLDQQF